jgi:hypothetical protein
MNIFFLRLVLLDMKFLPAAAARFPAKPGTMAGRARSGGRETSAREEETGAT